MSVAPKIAAAVAGTTVALGLGWLAVRGLGPDPAPATGIVDDRDEFDSFLRERGAEADADPGETPLFGPIPEEDALKIFAGLKSESDYDPEMYYRRKPNLSNPRDFPEHPDGRWIMRTNAAGFRENEELPENPDARVVVLGDSHTDGACDNRFSFANVLEGMLGERHDGKVVDVVNAGVGSHSFYNYLGALSKYSRELAPDVFVCVVYGGNDFLGTLRPRHYFMRKPLAGRNEAYIGRLDRFRAAAQERTDRNLGQAIMQLAYLSSFPAEAELAIRTACALSREMVRQADELGVDLIFVYLPPLWDVQRERYEPDYAKLAEALRLDDEDALSNADGMADRWLAALAEEGAEAIDLREPFKASPEDLYWVLDYHINLIGHQRVAEALLDPVDAALDL